MKPLCPAIDRRMWRSLTGFALIASLSACAGATVEPPPQPTLSPPPPTDTAAPIEQAASQAAPTDAGPPTPIGGGSGRIVFASTRQGNNSLNLYIMDADGSNVRALTEGIRVAMHPAPSQDGTRVAFWSTDEGEEYIYTVDVDGGDVTRLTDFSSFVEDWTADDRKLLIGADHRNETHSFPDLYVLDLESQELTEILDRPDSREGGATWSPDGQRILFTSNMNGNMDIFVMNADGSGLVNLTEDERHDIAPDWSPDGTRIAWSTCISGDNYDIWVMNADGSDKMPLVEQDSEDEAPVWSPDGRRIAFTSNRSGNFDIYTMDADGTNLTQLTDTEDADILPDWVP